MSNESSATRTATAVVFSFRDHFLGSSNFSALFQEGMLLVEETAEYLDIQGRYEAKKLMPPASLAYTSESMKLTTRLMQVASWLLLRRAVVNGEVTADQAKTHKKRVRLAPQSTAKPDGFDELPPKMRYLIQESFRLHDRILHLDKMISDQNHNSMPISGADFSSETTARLRVAFSA